MNELHLFAGAGGGILGGILLGHTTVCAVEIEPYCRKVLLQRQRDGILPKFPIWDDVQTFDGNPWRGKIDIICGGFPCQDISCAGKGAGIEGERSSMWQHMARIIDEVRPSIVFVENSPMLVGRGLSTVLGDLAEMGYDAKWGIVGAHHVSAPHFRDRIWIIARETERVTAEQTESGWICKSCKQDVFSGCGCDHGEWECLDCGEWSYPFHYDKRDGCSFCSSQNVVDSFGKRGCGWDSKWEYAKDAWQSSINKRENSRRMEWWDIEPKLGRVANGVDNRVDRLKAIGNGQVPAVAKLAWEILTQ